MPEFRNPDATAQLSCNLKSEMICKELKIDFQWTNSVSVAYTYHRLGTT